MRPLFAVHVLLVLCFLMFFNGVVCFYLMRVCSCLGVVCKAPAVHDLLDLATRSELALTGFILQDLWAVVATDAEKNLGRPKGSMQIAARTRQNMQSVALATAVICKEKDSDWHPFGPGHPLSEIHLERMFGRYRCANTNPDLTVTDFWRVNAQIAFRTAAEKQQADSSKAKPVEEPPLSDKQLLVVICFTLPFLHPFSSLSF